MINSEIIKIIEGALEKNKEKVIDYSNLLIQNLEKQGDKGAADRIRKVLERKKMNPVYLDELTNVPVDNESRMSIVDIEFPKSEEIKLILPTYTEIKVIDFIKQLKFKKQFNDMGIESVSTLLLYGPPGCGKTTVANFISQKTELPLIVARLDTLISSLLGSTGKNIRRIFEFANSKPCILFLDEFDSIAKARDDQYELGELKRVVNSLLQNIDEFIKDNILIAATNHHDLLDKAIWRRFNSIIEIPKPDSESVTKLILLFIENIKNDFTHDEKKIQTIAEMLKNYSPSEIKNVMHNSISKMVMNDEKFLTFERLIFDIYLFTNHTNTSQESMVKYLNENGISQKMISDFLNISIRQVRNLLN